MGDNTYPFLLDVCYRPLNNDVVQVKSKISRTIMENVHVCYHPPNRVLSPAILCVIVHLHVCYLSLFYVISPAETPGKVVCAKVYRHVKGIKDF